jgi:hypothetical protein
MALATYTDLQASIANWAHRSDLTAVIPDFVTLAEARISRDLRLRKQIAMTTATTTAGVQAVALPADWLEFENISAQGSPERQLTYVPIEHLDSRFPSGGYSGMPVFYTIEGDSLLLGPIPDTVYTLNIVYYARFPSLLTTATNWLMTNHPNIYLFATLIETMFFSQNTEQLQLFTQRYEAELTQLQNVDDRSTHSGSSLRVKTI